MSPKGNDSMRSTCLRQEACASKLMTVYMHCRLIVSRAAQGCPGSFPGFMGGDYYPSNHTVYRIA